MTAVRRLLVVLDVDSTLIDQEVIDLLADEAGCGDRVAEITERAMRGELDFAASLTARVGLLAGLPATALEAAYARTSFTPGAAELITGLREAGHRTGIVSGGFTWFTDRFAATLGIDHAEANVLELDGDTLTGRLAAPIVDRAAKADFVRRIAAEHGIDPADTVAVGDGANDIDMLDAAGTGIAFCAKPALVPHADHVVSERDLGLVLDLLGVRGGHLR